MTGIDVTRELARFAAELTYESLPARVRDHCKNLLLDALACAIAGHQAEETPQIAAFAAALAQSTESSIIGGTRASLTGATLLNGYLITAVTMCDVYRPTVTHITPVVVPPALAIAERDGCSGRDLLVALAAGLETTSRIGGGLDFADFRKRGWHGPGVIGPFGGAAAAGRLLGFDADTMARAFGLAGSQAAGTLACWGTPTIKFHQCRGALSGLMAALLAQQHFDSTSEFLTAATGGLYNAYNNGGHPDTVAAGLGERWELEQIALRPWPAASPLQAFVTGMFDLVEKHGVLPEQVQRLRVTASPHIANTNGQLARYNGKFQALLSIQYLAAAVLHDHVLTMDQFEPARYEDPALRRFAAERVEVKGDSSYSGTMALVEAEIAGAPTIVLRCEHPRGSPENPLTHAQIAEKFRHYAQARLSAARVEQVVAAVTRIEEFGNVRDLMAMLASPGADLAA